MAAPAKSPESTDVHDERDYATPNSPAGAITRADQLEVLLAFVHVSDFNPRRTFDEGPLAELAASIKAHGLLEPLVVRPHEGGYQIVAGERRYRAAALAGLRSVPVRVIEADDATAILLAGVENLQRQDLNPIEVAEWYRALLDRGKLSQPQLAQQVKRSQPLISKTIGLLRLPADVQELIRAGKLSQSHGEALLSYKDFPAVASWLGSYAAEHRLPVAALEKPGHEVWDQMTRLQVDGMLMVRSLAYDAPEQCKACPFGARRTVDAYWRYCLKPAHLIQLEREREDGRKRAIEERRQQAPQGLVDVDALGRTGYEHVETYTTPPAGCTEACPCRAQGVYSNNPDRPFPICQNPDRYRALRTEQEEQGKRLRQERAEARKTALIASLDKVMFDGPLTRRALAYAADRALQAGLTESAPWVLQTFAPGLKLKKDKRSPGVEALMQLEVQALLRLLVAGPLAGDIWRRQMWGQESKDLDWWFADAEGAPDGD